MTMTKLSSFTFLHASQIDALYTVYTSTQIKTFFDSQAAEIRAYINDTLTEEIDTNIATKAEVAAVVLGSITDDSLTNAKLATDIKVGSLAAVDTLDKSSVTASINSLLQQVGLISPLHLYSLGDVTISADTDLTERYNVYDNLTIDVGYTLSSKKGKTVIFVKDTLTVNGTLSANGKGGAGGEGDEAVEGDGGAGGGILVIFANEIAGTGTISANGSNGTASTTGGTNADTENAGETSTFMSLAVTTGFSTSVCDNLAMGVCLLSDWDYGGQGGYSGGRDDTSTYTARGGNGGRGIGAAPGTGDGQTVSLGSQSTGGGGGGGGGFIAIVCATALPAGLTLAATGGNGGNGNGTAGAGGGGGGGFISLIAPSNSSTTSVVGGSKGSNSGAGNTATNGTAGTVELHAI